MINRRQFSVAAGAASLAGFQWARAQSEAPLVLGQSAAFTGPAAQLGIQFYQGAKLYFAATGVGQTSALLRYVVLARLLGPEQLGLAATLVVTGAFFDLISDTASDRFLIQDRHGAEPSVQNLVHFVYVVRGFLIAGALALFSIPLAGFYKSPNSFLGSSSWGSRA